MLERLGLIKGRNFSLHYDFGDDWMFTIHAQKIEEEIEWQSPVMLKAKGEIEQYAVWGDWEEDDEDWE